MHLGDAAHAGAADADEMDAADLVFHRAASMQISATARRGFGLGQGAGLLGHRRQLLARQFAQQRGQPLRREFRLRQQDRRAGSDRKRALPVWWSSTACGKGTSTLATPAAASSATVSAPARQTTRSAAA
jgi:hypothetical protein